MVIFHPNSPLKSRNTFNIEATARWWVEFTNDYDLRQIIIRCRQMELDWYIISGGSNIILTDQFKGVYIHPTGKSIERTADGLIVADAGVVWDEFVEWCTVQGFWGVECLSWIPGLVGAAPVQNIGAYGQEAKDTIRWVEYFDTNSLQVVRINTEDCNFGYRSSIFKHELNASHAIVVRVAFKMSEQKPETLHIDYGDLRSRVEAKGETSLSNIRNAVIEIRKEKLPDPAILGNAGSFFKNPVVSTTVFERIIQRYPSMPHFKVAGGVKIPAGWLIDTAGWKGYRRGNVGVHEKQALVIVNHSDAKSSEILALSQLICDDILDKFDISLNMEVNIL